MKQVVQPVGGGPVSVLDVPRPTIGPTEVLVQTVASVISPGTERAVTALAQSSLLSKARSRPDLVRQVIQRARTEGIAATLQTVRARLAGDLPLGYSAAGIALEVGDAVSGVRPGQLVATAGAGAANHAEWQRVPGLLCTPVPAGVTAEQAAFATISSIAMHGLRLAKVGPGSKVVVVGLGLVGQLTARLAMASGCGVAGIDVAAEPLRVAQESGVLALEEKGAETTQSILAWSRGRGADAVLLCAAGSSSSAVAQRTPALCRDKARVVVVGDVGLELSRTPFYEKELSLLFARSYGPGRHEREYEEYGIDYPAGQIRWTEGRNLEAILDMLASARLVVDDLVTHTFPIERAGEAYKLIESRTEPYLAVSLSYPREQTARERPIVLQTKASTSPAIGWIGAGAFSSGTLLPAFRAAGFDRFRSIASASGLSARRTAERHGFEQAVSSIDEMLSDDAIEVIVIATPHDTHAEFAARALRAGKHVWCEKPIGLSFDELNDVEAAWEESGRVFYVGHNRRWAPLVTTVRDQLGGAHAAVNYRVNAGPIPSSHWYLDRRQGGRLLGEVCHFVDACAALVSSNVVGARAFAGTGGELLLADDVVATLSHANGSLSTINYASHGHVGTAKERVEILGGGHTWVIDDFRNLLRDGKETESSSRQDKGHRNAVTAFRSAMQGDRADTEALLSSARATLALGASLGLATWSI